MIRYAFEARYANGQVAIAPIALPSPAGSFSKGDYFYINPNRRFVIAEVRHALQQDPGGLIMRTALVLSENAADDHPVPLSDLAF
jgi:hypothetical protein